MVNAEHVYKALESQMHCGGYLVGSRGEASKIAKWIRDNTSRHTAHIFGAEGKCRVYLS